MKWDSPFLWAAEIMPAPKSLPDECHCMDQAAVDGQTPSAAPHQ